jgi:trehalose/maltose transport system permease protein
MFSPSLVKVARRSLFYGVVVLILVYILFPVYWLINSSLKSPASQGIVTYWPADPWLIGYTQVISSPYFIVPLHNSLLVSAAVVVLTLAFSAMAAYALGRLRFRGRRLFRFMVLSMIAFPQIALLPALYQMITNPCSVVGASCRQFQLYNTRTALVMTDLLLTLPLTIWFLSVYVAALPYEIEEAAYVDGATPFQAFWRILLPLAGPGLVTTGLLAFIFSWNDFLFALTFTQDISSRTAPVAIANYGDIGAGAIFALAASVIVLGPVTILALVFQQQIAAGLTGVVTVADAEPGWPTRLFRRIGLSQFGASATARVTLLVLGIGALVFVYYGMRAVTFPFGLDYGEGPLLAQTARLAHGQNIYRADLHAPPFTISNYPPLFMLTQVPFYDLFGPAFWYGRAISWLSMVVAAVCIALTIDALTGDRTAALIGGLLLLVIPYVSYWAMLNRIDGLALALSWAALLVLVRWPQRRWSLFVVAALLTAAIYTRQSYALAAPLAAFAWLVSQRAWRRAWMLAALVGSACLALFLLLNVLTGGGFFFNIVTANVNEYRIGDLQNYASDLWQFMPLLVLCSAATALLAGWFHARGWWLAAPYLLGATLSALTIGKIGSNVNYLLELSAAMCLATGVLLAWLRTHPLLQSGLLLLLALQVFLLIPGAKYQLFTQYRLMGSEDAAQIAQLVEQTGGAVLADEGMDALALAGKPIYLQPFEMTQLARAGMWNQQPLLDAIDNKAFALVMLFNPPQTDLLSQRWTPEMLAAIERNYRVTQQIGSTFVYQPRP